MPRLPVPINPILTGRFNLWPAIRFSGRNIVNAAEAANVFRKSRLSIFVYSLKVLLYGDIYLARGWNYFVGVTLWYRGFNLEFAALGGPS